MAYCAHHPAIETQRGCVACLAPYCDACLVEFLAHPYCGPCRDRRLREVEGRVGADDAPLAGTGVVDLGGWLNAGWQIVSADIGAWIGATLLWALLSVMSCYVCVGPLTCGLYLMVYRKLTHGHTEAGTMFDGFRRFLSAFLLMLLIWAGSVGVGIVLAIPVGVLAAATNNEGLTDAASLVINGLSFVVSVGIEAATLFALPHIAARNVNPVDALTASWAVFRRNPWMFLVTALIFNLLRGAGLLACCVGALVTFPWVAAATAKAYADHFGIRGWEAT